MALVSDGEYVWYDGPLESYWLNTPFGCGWVGARNVRIVANAPIFRRFVGWDLNHCPPSWKWEKIADETEESIALLATDKQLTVKERLMVQERETDAREAAIKFGRNQ